MITKKHYFFIVLEKVLSGSNTVLFVELYFTKCRVFYVYSRVQAVIFFFIFPGSLTTVFQVFLGYQAGQIIVSYAEDRQRILRFLIWSLITSVIGIGLCGGSKHMGLIPLNKNLW